MYVFIDISKYFDYIFKSLPYTYLTLLNFKKKMYYSKGLAQAKIKK